jgi:hypothetical protein
MSAVSATLQRSSNRFRRLLGVFRRISFRTSLALMAALGVLIGIITIPLREVHEASGAFVTSLISNDSFGVQLTNPRLTFFGISADGANIYFPDIPLVLDVTSLSCSVRLFSLFKLSVRTHCDATFLGGPLAFESAHPLVTGNSTLKLVGDKISITRYPLVSVLGFTRGDLSFESSDLLLSNNGVPKGSLSFAIRGIENPGQSSLLHGSAQALMRSFVSAPELLRTIKVPPFSQVSIEGELILKSSSDVTTPRLLVSLPLGTISSEGEWKTLDSSPQIALKSTVHLNKKGISVLGPYLPLASQGSLTALHDSFLISLTGLLSKPSIHYSSAPPTAARTPPSARPKDKVP